MKSTNMPVSRKVGEGGLLDAQRQANIARMFSRSQANPLDPGYVLEDHTRPARYVGTASYDQHTPIIQTHRITDAEMRDFSKAGPQMTPPPGAPPPTAAKPPPVPGGVVKPPDVSFDKPQASTPTPAIKPPDVSFDKPQGSIEVKPGGAPKPATTPGQMQPSGTPPMTGKNVRAEMGQAGSSGFQAGRALGASMVSPVGTELAQAGVSEAQRMTGESTNRMLQQQKRQQAQQSLQQKQQLAAQAKHDPTAHLKQQHAQQQAAARESAAVSARAKEALSGAQRAQMQGAPPPAPFKTAPTPTSSLQARMQAPAPKGAMRFATGGQGAPMLQQRADVPRPGIPPAPFKRSQIEIDPELIEVTPGNLEPDDSTYDVVYDGRVTTKKRRQTSVDAAAALKRGVEEAEHEETDMVEKATTPWYDLSKCMGFGGMGDQVEQQVRSFRDTPFYAQALECLARQQKLSAQLSKLDTPDWDSPVGHFVDPNKDKRKKLGKELNDCRANFKDLQSKVLDWKAKKVRELDNTQKSQSAWGDLLEKGTTTHGKKGDPVDYWVTAGGRHIPMEGNRGEGPSLKEQAPFGGKKKEAKGGGVAGKVKGAAEKHAKKTTKEKAASGAEAQRQKKEPEAPKKPSHYDQAQAHKKRMESALTEGKKIAESAGPQAEKRWNSATMKVWQHALNEPAFWEHEKLAEHHGKLADMAESALKEMKTHHGGGGEKKEEAKPAAQSEQHKPGEHAKQVRGLVEDMRLGRSTPSEALKKISKLSASSQEARDEMKRQVKFFGGHHSFLEAVSEKSLFEDVTDLAKSLLSLIESPVGDEGAEKSMKVLGTESLEDARNACEHSARMINHVLGLTKGGDRAPVRFKDGKDRPMEGKDFEPYETTIETHSRRSHTVHHGPPGKDKPIGKISYKPENPQGKKWVSHTGEGEKTHQSQNAAATRVLQHHRKTQAAKSWIDETGYVLSVRPDAPTFADVRHDLADMNALIDAALLTR